MTAQAFPALGFDPAPGDPAAARDLARTIGLLAHEVGAAASTLSGADSQDWTGLHADAFRAHLHQDVVPLVRTAAGCSAGPRRHWAPGAGCWRASRPKP